MLPLLLFWVLFATSAHAASNASLSDFDWIKLSPSTNLTWVSCYGNRECARLQVPLDYTNPSGRVAAIALLRVKATAPTEDYLGPIIITPSGYGGRGVSNLLTQGDDFAAIVGPQFDVVGFDPRGFGFSTPRVSFYERCAERAAAKLPPITLNSSEDALARLWAEGQLLGLAAQKAGDHEVLEHITTDVVARDMLEITRAHGYEKLRYWGLSHGSSIGGTFAALFPDSVERIVLDGILPLGNIYAGNWSRIFFDTDKTLAAFFESCVSVGPQECAFHANTTEQISENLEALFSSLKKQPLPVYVAATSSTPTISGILDYSMLFSTLLNVLYTPQAWPQLAQVFADLAVGNATSAYYLSGAARVERCGAEEDPWSDNLSQGVIAVACMDALPVNDTVAELREFYDGLDVGPFGEVLSFRLTCSGWRVRAPSSHFRGPFSANTSFPMLLISNTADPVMPIANAHETAKDFPGSVILTFNTPGHTSVAGPSLCIYRAVRAYFINGTLPDPGTICERDTPVWPSIKKLSKRYTDEEEVLARLSSMEVGWRPLGAF